MSETNTGARVDFGESQGVTLWLGDSLPVEHVGDSQQPLQRTVIPALTCTT